MLAFKFPVDAGMTIPMAIDHPSLDHGAVDAYPSWIDDHGNSGHTRNVLKVDWEILELTINSQKKILWHLP